MASLPITTWQVIWEKDFSEFVREVYGKPYRLQQQGEMLGQDSVIQISVPHDCEEDDPQRFQAWLDADPQQPVLNPEWEADRDLQQRLGAQGSRIPPAQQYWQPNDFKHELYWTRTFYPPLGDLLDDLLAKGLIQPGEYAIHTWW